MLTEVQLAGGVTISDSFSYFQAITASSDMNKSSRLIAKKTTSKFRRETFVDGSAKLARVSVECTAIACCHNIGTCHQSGLTTKNNQVDSVSAWLESTKSRAENRLSYDLWLYIGCCDSSLNCHAIPQISLSIAHNKRPERILFTLWQGN
ncbi:MAG: hypothetical protein JJU48_06795 [Methylophaga sp.]|nr:hypothetical protein [Methylophaga sp.]